MKEYEFQYYIRDGYESNLDEEIFLSEVVRGDNKIIAEENFLELLKERNVDASMVVVVTCNELPEMEEEVFPSLEDDIFNEDELYGEYGE